MELPFSCAASPPVSPGGRSRWPFLTRASETRYHPLSLQAIAGLVGFNTRPAHLTPGNIDPKSLIRKVFTKHARKKIIKT